MGSLAYREVRRGLKASLIWSVSIGVIVVLMMYLFPSIAKDQQQWNQVISQLPKGLLAGFGMDKLSLSNIFGYYGTQAYPFILLFSGIYAGMLTTGLLAKEEAERTIDFLLAKPITRAEVVTGKLVATVALLVSFNVVLFLFTWLSFVMFQTDSFRFATLLLLGLGNGLITLIFASLGFLLSAFGRRSGGLSTFTIGIVFVTYLIGVISDISNKLRGLRIMSPFEYVSATHIVLDRNINLTAVLALVFVSAVLIFLAYNIYQRRDISG